jgi:GT2 family glycosyltransferase
MLAVCIPIFNFDARKLVADLLSQINDNQLDIEIIILDDDSDKQFKEFNTPLSSHCLYAEMDKNIGRSSIRNKFLNYTKASHLLFLDCDSAIIKKDFLLNYVKEIEKNPAAVICGGRLYPQKCPSKNQALSWKNGIYKETKSLEERKKYGHLSFMSSNFVIPSAVFAQIPFDESLKEYGPFQT